MSDKDTSLSVQFCVYLKAKLYNLGIFLSLNLIKIRIFQLEIKKLGYVWKNREKDLKK